MSLDIKVEFSGGLELLFSNQRQHSVTIPSIDPTTSEPTRLQYLINYLRDNLLKERLELFVENDTVRPGILVLVNDTDWELEGEGDYVLKDGDEIVFISTLHGYAGSTIIPGRSIAQ
ncbi:putative acts as a sulfur carrier required for 2-thiolation of mcm(5)S(2)U at tRNA wobble positions of cytosolic tRNA(Lys), tRNA(Glu) and tRNA(Gln) [Lyophyllum shimeji]|uniref:Ubiquitin-related modifier 1 n=1 Tax=Lyophyllum shimeji TaxID=47721 RepID=A0A9P3USW9_LYOSH|nr:putative acts as a sulfur carrier required for 2-thiolation of mcm(5)S(2)U at tRNA wobble positions of cytosolic tRNA(Lys), tRNA(Glu) and tRNA(Gln) [Lyophyllum shimeji]